MYQPREDHVRCAHSKVCCIVCIDCAVTRGSRCATNWIQALGAAGSAGDCTSSTVPPLVLRGATSGLCSTVALDYCTLSAPSTSERLLGKRIHIAQRSHK
jgi:hypothetical protein